MNTNISSNTNSYIKKIKLKTQDTIRQRGEFTDEGYGIKVRDAHSPTA
jgi:hypothetical protein